MTRNSLPTLHPASRGNIASLHVPPLGAEFCKKIDNAAAPRINLAS